MRIQQLHKPLTESKRVVKQMLLGIYLLDSAGNKHPYDYSHTGIRKYADKLDSVMKREDRVVWAMRYYIKMLLMELKRTVIIEKELPEGGGKAVWPEEMERKLRSLDWLDLGDLPGTIFSSEGFVGWDNEKLEKDFGVETSYRVLGREKRTQRKKEVADLQKELLSGDFDTLLKYTRHLISFSGIKSLLEKIGHYLGIGEVYADREPNNPVLAYQFGRQPIKKILFDLSRRAAPLQRKYKETDVAEGETILEFPGGWKWVLLSDSYCRKEGAAMGHCGNYGNPSRKASHRVLSLREPVKDRGYKPHLTFIWDSIDGTLGEMKGPRNSKPHRRYHEYIVPLLLLDMVTSVAGGGYAPQNNFHLSDLDVPTLKNLVKQKRGLFAHEGIPMKITGPWSHPAKELTRIQDQPPEPRP